MRPSIKGLEKSSMVSAQEQFTALVIRLGGDFPEPPSFQLLASSMILEMGSGEIGPGRILCMMMGILEGGGLVIRSSSSCGCCAGEIGRDADISWGLPWPWHCAWTRTVSIFRANCVMLHFCWKTPHIEPGHLCAPSSQPRSPEDQGASASTPVCGLWRLTFVVTEATFSCVFITDVFR